MSNDKGNKKFGRVCKLYLSNAASALDVSHLRVTFDVHQALTSAPNWSTIRVYNVDEDTISQIQYEFDRVDLYVGYGDADEATHLFQGQVIQFNAGSEVGPDTWLDIVAQDGELATNWTTVNHTLTAGWTQREAAQEAARAMAENGATVGHVGGLPETPMPRGKAVYGMARDYLDALRFNASSDWSIQDGRVELLPFEETTPDEAVVLTAATGLIGVPKRTVDGIIIKSLIDPAFQRGGMVEIDNASIQDPNIDLEYKADNYRPSVSSDGVYKIRAADHVGDTRGRDWYTTLTCISPYSGDYRPDTLDNAIPNPRTQPGEG